MNYERHFLSACWPEISGEDFEYLKDSISNSGLRDSIVLLDGEILDGWNRYRACQAIGMEPHFVPYEGDDPSQYVRDKHTRRSLTLTQRLACIGLMATWAPSSRPNKGAPGAPLLKKDLAKQAGSSERTAQQVMSVIKSGDTETIKEMIDGTLSAKAADAKVKGHTEKPIAKPKAEARPEIDDGMLSESELIAEMQETQAENQQLQERVTLMASDDKAAEIDKLLTRINGLEGRINQLMMQVKTSADGEKYHATVIHKLRKLLGVEGHKEIVAAVTELVADRRLAA